MSNTNIKYTYEEELKARMDRLFLELLQENGHPVMDRSELREVIQGGIVDLKMDIEKEDSKATFIYTLIIEGKRIGSVGFELIENGEYQFEVKVFKKE
jgi:hypothetical protein